MHAGNKLVAGVFQLENGFTVDSGWLELVGWDFPEAAYVASFANFEEHSFLGCVAKAGNIRSSGCHRLWFEGPLRRKENRPSVSGGSVPALKRL